MLIDVHIPWYDTKHILKVLKSFLSFYIIVKSRIYGNFYYVFKFKQVYILCNELVIWKPKLHGMAKACD
jgi:hypothetical protein